MHVYVHRSGDLGFSLQRPFRNGGSSRYLTISFLLVHRKFSHLPGRIVRKLYNRRRRSGTDEVKGLDLTDPERIFVARKTRMLLGQYPEIELVCVTINKMTAKGEKGRDWGRVFRHVNRLVLMERVRGISDVMFIPDVRSVKNGNGISLSDHLQAELWFDLQADTVIENRPRESLKTLNLQFIDWIGHIVWKRYEDDETAAYEILKDKVDLTPWWETLSGYWN
ncbi:MAG: hypothetical protein DRH50_06840 [Deltaproteobacteria bacterium]|nr:MAG: hypothetical protein DRH50_06840 [Deltaproteobacteria bacterium]